MQSGSEMSGVVGGGLEFSGEADGAGCVGAEEIQAEASQEGEVPRRALPSIAMTRPFTAGQTSPSHTSNRNSSSIGDSVSKTLRIVS